MTLEIPHSFYRFKQTDKELAASQILTVMQKQHIHNQRVDVAETLIHMDDDVQNPLEHIKERARLRGMLDAYASLISFSELAETYFDQQNTPTNRNQ